MLPLVGCARPTLAEAVEKAHGADAGAAVVPPDDEKDAGSGAKPDAASSQGESDASTGEPPKPTPDAGASVPEPDSGSTVPEPDAGNPGVDAGSPEGDAGSHTNPLGCPTEEPKLFTGKPCANFTDTCKYGNTECQCGAVVWVCN